MCSIPTRASNTSNYLSFWNKLTFSELSGLEDLDWLDELMIRDEIAPGLVAFLRPNLARLKAEMK